MIKEVNVQVVLTQEQRERLEILTTVFNDKKMSAIPLTEDEMLSVVISSQCFQHIDDWIKNTELVIKGFDGAEKPCK